MDRGITIGMDTDATIGMDRDATTGMDRGTTIRDVPNAGMLDNLAEGW